MNCEVHNHPSAKTIVYSNIFKTTNDNVKDWLSSELEKPTRDNESGENCKYFLSVMINSIWLRPK